MRDEVDAFNQFLGTQTVQMDRLIESPQRSIERLTTDFLVGLNTDFPSTIPAVTKTAQKIVSRDDAQGSIRCTLCDGQRDVLDVDWRRKHTLFDLPTAEGEPRPDPFLEDASAIRINESLCYPCQNLTQDVKDETRLQVAKGAAMHWTLPSFVKVSREDMAQDISSFLL
jgi:hypothetical protein